MWVEFCAALLIALALFYIPGFLFCRGIGTRNFPAVAAAPLASVAAYCIVGMALSACGVFCTWLNVGAITLVLCAIPLFWRALRRHDDTGPAFSCEASSRPDWIALALYVAAGLILGIFTFAFALDTPYSIVEEYDNAFHLNVTRAMVDSGSWSIFTVSKYISAADQAIAPLAGGGFYPAAWHITCSFVVSLLGLPVPLAENAVNFALMCVVFPISMAYFMRTVFPERRVVYLGSLVVLAFLPFPWVLCIWGPLFSNIFACALVPLVLALFFGLVKSLEDRAFELRKLVLLILGICSIAFAQPNTIFFCIVALTPYCVWKLWTLNKLPRFRERPMLGRVLAVLFLALVIGFWVALFNLPFMESLLSYNWAARCGLAEALREVLAYDFTWYAPQYALAFVVLVGFVGTFFKREYLWIACAYAFFCVAFVLCVSTEGLAKHLIAGFWYTDSFRVMACMVLLAIPLAALGLDIVISLAAKLLARWQALSRVIVTLLLLAFCALVYAPLGIPEGSPFASAHELFRTSLRDHYSYFAYVVYPGYERDFVDRVKEVVGEEELVVNIPDDGSAYSYGVNGLRTYYRDLRTYTTDLYESPEDVTWETYESQKIRLNAKDIATDPEVRAAFDAIGAQYVLVLDKGEAFDWQPKFVTYDPELWVGLMGIDDDTPGFELVLGEEDMRLYRIDSNVLNAE